MDSVKDFSKTYNTMRIITLSALGVTLAVAIICFVMYQSISQQVGKKVYVITDRGTFAAINTDNRKVSVHEARNHVKTFMGTMFAHDADSYKKNIEAALHLIDEKSGTKLYFDFEQGQVQQNYVRYNSRTEIAIDSTDVRMDQLPISGVVYAQQNLFFGEEKSTLPIAAQFNLEQVFRSDANPFGLQLTHFDFIGYQPIAKK